MSFKYAFLFFTVLFISCQNSGENNTESQLSQLKKEFGQTKADSSFNKLLQAYGQAIVNSENNKDKEKWLLEAIDVCAKPEKSNIKEIFQTELLKLNPQSPLAKDIIWNLAQNMQVKNKNEVASLLFQGYISRFPNDSRSKNAEKFIIQGHKNIEQYMKTKAEMVFQNPDNRGLNAENTQLYIDICESFALVYPENPMAPEYLFRAAEMARALESFPKMMSLYDWISAYFPNYKKAPLALFLKGFAMDTEFKKKEDAKVIYEAFLKKYPNDSLSNDVKFLLKNLGKSDEQIFKEMEVEKK